MYKKYVFFALIACLSVSAMESLPEMNDCQEIEDAAKNVLFFARRCEIAVKVKQIGTVIRRHQSSKESIHDLLSYLKKQKIKSVELNSIIIDSKKNRIPHYLAKYGTLELFKKLTTDFQMNIHAVRKDGKTPFHMARKYKHFRLADFILRPYSRQIIKIKHKRKVRLANWHQSREIN
jgi:hypothetical protein